MSGFINEVNPMAASRLLKQGVRQLIYPVNPSLFKRRVATS